MKLEELPADSGGIIVAQFVNNIELVVTIGQSINPGIAILNDYRLGDNERFANLILLDDAGFDNCPGKWFATAVGVGQFATADLYAKVVDLESANSGQAVFDGFDDCRSVTQGGALGAFDNSGDAYGNARGIFQVGADKNHPRVGRSRLECQLDHLPGEEPVAF